MREGAPQGRLLPVEGVRALAALSILVYHSGTRFWQGGFVGVEIFFALSGFLAARSCLKEIGHSGGVSWRNWCARRLLRLYPALATVVAALLASGCLLFGRDVLRKQLLNSLCALLPVADVVRALDLSGLHWMGHVWFLSLDLKYCLLLPPFLLALRKALPDSGKRTAAVAGIALGAWAWRAALSLAGVGPAYLNNAFGTRADAFLAGVVLALVCDDAGLRARLGASLGTGARAMGLALAALFAAGLFADVNSPHYIRWGGAAVEAAVFLLLAPIVLGADNFWTRRLSRPAFVRAGGLSYGVYLWHYPVYVGMGELGFVGGRTIPVCLALSTAAALASWTLVERRFLRIGDRFRAPSPRADARDEERDGDPERVQRA